MTDLERLVYAAKLARDGDGAKAMCLTGLGFLETMLLADLIEALALLDPKKGPPRIALCEEHNRRIAA